MKRVLCVALLLLLLVGCSSDKAEGSKATAPITIVSAIPTNLSPAELTFAPTVNLKGVRLYDGEIPKPFVYPTGDNAMFSENMVLVLPIENARYCVYDCYGTKVAELSSVSNDFAASTGLYLKNSQFGNESLSTLQPIYFNKDDVALVNNVADDIWFSTDLRTGDMAVYDRNGTVMFTVNADNPDNTTNSAVYKIGGNYVLYACGETKYIDGQFTDSYTLEPAIYDAGGTLIHSFGDDGLTNCSAIGNYFLGYLNGGGAAIFDANGKLLMQPSNCYSLTGEGYYVYQTNDDYTVTYQSYFLRSKYVVEYSNSNDEVKYLDSNLQYLTQDEYIRRQTNSRLSNADMQIAETDARITISTGGRTIDIDKKFSDEELESYNEYYAVLSSLEHTTSRLVYLPTGEVIGEYKDVYYDNSVGYTSYTFVLTKTDACLQRTFSEVNSKIERSYTIFGSDGKVRYETDNNLLAPLTDDLMILIRGPYMGIADYDGNWVIKNVRPDIARDSELDYGFDSEFYMFYDTYNNTNHSGDE